MASAAMHVSSGSRSRPAGSVTGRCDVVAADDQDVDVALERQMLEPVVEHVDRRAEVVLGEAPAR